MNMQAWIIAIGAGWLVGFLALKGAGKATIPLKIMIFVMAVGAVVLGEILSWAFYVTKEGGPFAPIEAARTYFDNLGRNIGDFIFALAGGLIGAFIAAKMASKPQLAPDIEVSQS